MTVFPQLSSGAVAQFPFRRELHFRTVVNQAPDGSEVFVSDPDARERAWELSFDQLTDVEWQGIQDLFIQVEGRLQSFLFLEPAANLLSWSETLSDPVWQSDPGITVLEGQPDPFGGAGAGQLSNSGALGTFRQTLNVPATFRYAGSVWARTSDSGALVRVSDGNLQVAEVAIDSDNQWKRYSVQYGLTSATETIEFSIVVPAAGTVEFFGPQLEAQVGTSAYKKTAQQAGVYPGARFDQDALADRATDVNRHSGVIRISWKPSPT